MKTALVITIGLMLGSAAVMMGQSSAVANSQQMGRGRGGAPYAWNDKNKDGVCDVTGQAIGQGRGNGAMRGGRRGRGGAAGRGFGMGRGMWAQQQTSPARSQN